MSAITVVNRTTVKVYSSLAEAQALAGAGKGNQLHYFRFSPNSPKRKYYVDNNGWLLVANGAATVRGMLSQSSSDSVKPDNTQTIITAQEAAAIPDLGRIQISSRNRTGVHLESSNNTILSRFLNYTTLTYLEGEESLWNDTGTSTSQPATIYANNPNLADRLLSQIVYASGAATNVGTMQWMPFANIEGQPRYNPQLWVRSPVQLDTTPLRSFRFTPLGGVDFSNQPGGYFSSESLGNEVVLQGRIFSGLPDDHTYTITLNIIENKPFRLVYGGQFSPLENKGIIFYCQDGKVRVSAGTNTTLNGVSNWSISNLNGWYETNFELGNCGENLDLTVTVNNGVLTASHNGNNINIPITQTSYNGKLYFNYDRNAGFEGLVRVVARDTESETTSGLNITELEKNTTTPAIELPIDTGNELVEVYSSGTTITDQANAVAEVTIAEEIQYNLYYSQKPTGVQTTQVSPRSAAQIRQNSTRDLNSHSWSYIILDRPLYPTKVTQINIPFPTNHNGVNLHLVLGTSYFHASRAYSTAVDLGYINVAAGQSVELSAADLRSRNNGSDIELTQDFNYFLFICNDSVVRIFGAGISLGEFDPETRIYENAPWTNNYADTDYGSSQGLSAEIIGEF